MSDALDRMSPEESWALARRRMHRNWLIFGVLVAFVVGVYFISFSHIRTEVNEPQLSSAAQ
jgi:hypothetical protein